MFARVLAVLLLTVTVVAAPPRCDQCQRVLGEKYLRSNDGRSYCSQKCFEATLPHCKICGKVITGRAMRSGDDFYCSSECYSSVLPVCEGCGKHSAQGMVFKTGRDRFFCLTCAVLPKCFSCMLPAASGGMELEDGRHLCASCKESAVWDFDQAEELFNQVRAMMRSELGIGTSHHIRLRMLDLPAMQRRSPDFSPGLELGLYVYDATITTVTRDRLTLGGLKEETSTYRSNVSHTIFFLSGTPAEKLAEVFAHELAHDWTQKYYPGIKDLIIKEGVAEYFAYQFNRLKGRHEMNLRMVNNPDPIYGDGFRMIMEIGGEDGDFSAVRRFLRRQIR